MTAHLPEVPQCGDQAQGDDGVAVAERPVQRAAHVGVLGVEPVEPFGLCGAGELAGGLFGKGHEVVAVRSLGGLDLDVPGELFRGELTDGVQQREPGLECAPVDDSHHALVDQ